MEQGSSRIWKFWNKHRKYVHQSHLCIIRVFNLLSFSAGNKMFVGQFEFDSAYTLISMKAYKQMGGDGLALPHSTHVRGKVLIITVTVNVQQKDVQIREKHTLQSFCKPSFQSCQSANRNVSCVRDNLHSNVTGTGNSFYFNHWLMSLAWETRILHPPLANNWLTIRWVYTLSSF